MPVYLDTNIFVYSFLNQGIEKQEFSTKVIDVAIKNNELNISTLVLQEFIYILAKNNIENVLIKDYFDKLIPFTVNSISKNIFEEAVHLSFKLNYFQNINDCIHIKFAERHCRKLVTFEKDFEKFRKHTNLEIEIL